jgi:hypothetical protein
MPTTQTQLFPPPLRASSLSLPEQRYLLTLQNLLPLVTVDTSGGNIAEAAPAAGLNSSTGQSNQNMEITYIKTSTDGHSFTLSGVQGGPFVLSAQFDVIKIKSDGTDWWPVG